MGSDFRSIIEFASLSEYCRWRGLDCGLDRRVTRMEFACDESFPVASLDWIPPEVYFFHVRRKDIKKELDTRLLPRCMEGFLVFQCGILGKVNLQTLPATMKGFYAHNNHISGEIRLYNLPKNMELINLSGNAIIAIFIAEEDTTLSLIKVDVSSQQGKVRVWHFGEKSALNFLQVNDVKYKRL